MPIRPPVCQTKWNETNLWNIHRKSAHITFGDSWKIQNDIYSMQLWAPSTTSVSSQLPFKLDSVCVFILDQNIIPFVVVTFKTMKWEESFEPISELFHIFIRTFFERFISARHTNTQLTHTHTWQPYSKPFQEFLKSFLFVLRHRLQNGRVFGVCICFCFHAIFYANDFLCCYAFVLASCPKNVCKNYRY